MANNSVVWKIDGKISSPHTHEAASEKIENSERFENVYTEKKSIMEWPWKNVYILIRIAITNKFAFYIHYIHFVWHTEENRSRAFTFFAAAAALSITFDFVWAITF